MYTRVMIYDEFTPTEFAGVLEKSQKVTAVFVTVRELGFNKKATRKEIYERAVTAYGYQPLRGVLAAGLSQRLTPEQGKMYMTVNAAQPAGNGKFLYGFVIRWRRGIFNCEHDYARPEDTLPPGATLVLAKYPPRR